MEKVAEDLVGELLVAAVGFFGFAGDDDDFSSGIDVPVSIASGVLAEHKPRLAWTWMSLIMVPTSLNYSLIILKEGDNKLMCSFRE